MKTFLLKKKKKKANAVLVEFSIDLAKFFLSYFSFFGLMGSLLWLLKLERKTLEVNLVAYK